MLRCAKPAALQLEAEATTVEAHLYLTGVPGGNRSRKPHGAGSSHPQDPLASYGVYVVCRPSLLPHCEEHRRYPALTRSILDQGRNS